MRQGARFAFRWHARPSAHAHPAAAASTRANQVDEADFYNDQINERLQEEDGAMREEYVKWRKHDLPKADVFGSTAVAGAFVFWKTPS